MHQSTLAFYIKCFLSIFQAFFASQLLSVKRLFIKQILMGFESLLEAFAPFNTCPFQYKITYCQAWVLVLIWSWSGLVKNPTQKKDQSLRSTVLCLMSHAPCHMSYVPCPMSYVPCLMSHILCSKVVKIFLSYKMSFSAPSLTLK